jgi:hypothetical protein
MEGEEEYTYSDYEERRWQDLKLAAIMTTGIVVGLKAAATAIYHFSKKN